MGSEGAAALLAELENIPGGKLCVRCASIRLQIDGDTVLKHIENSSRLATSCAGSFPVRTVVGSTSLRSCVRSVTHRESPEADQTSPRYTGSRSRPSMISLYVTFTLSVGSSPEAARPEYPNYLAYGAGYGRARCGRSYRRPIEARRSPVSSGCAATGGSQRTCATRQKTV